MERLGLGMLFPFLALICLLPSAHGQNLESNCTDGDENLHDFVLQGLDGSDIPLANLSGKVVLVVNVATFWGFTPQYLQLNALREELDGLFEVLGVPCNQFRLQEPARNDELLNALKYVRPGNGYTPNFIMTAKTDVNGANEHPFYTFLKVRFE